MPSVPSGGGRRQGNRGRERVRALAIVDDEDEIDERVAEFLKDQDLTERGIAERKQPKDVLGSAEIDEEAAKTYCRDVVRILRSLKERRDMELREVKLVVAIDDPQNDQIRAMGAEDSTGVSRDEMAMALEEVAAGTLPKDRIALRALHTELSSWPFLESDEENRAPSTLEATGSADSVGAPAPPPPSTEAPAVPGWRPGQARPPIGRDPKEVPAGPLDRLPDWFGYGTLWAVTLVPVFIVATVVSILFFSSLK